MDDPQDPLEAAEVALRAVGGGTRRNRAQRRSRRGTEPGSGRHPLGATRQFPSERKQARQRRRRSR
jgi:hypothetical protein